MQGVKRFGWFVCGVLAVAITGSVSGCRSATMQPAQALPSWDVDRAETITWQSDDPHFEQDFALEASGLAASGEYLYVTSEKYARLLLVDTTGDYRVRVVPLDVPRHAELEGVALTRDGLAMCDEAHAAVYGVPVADKEILVGNDGVVALQAEEHPMVGVGVRGGKIGFEGIEVSREDGTVFLLLERSGDEAAGCVSKIYPLHPENGQLMSRTEPLEIALEDCAWRLTGLAWWKGTLLALKTQFPGERYEIVTVDLENGDIEVALDLTELLRALATEGWSNNVEGIAVAPDGALWLVADNKVTGVIDDPFPPPTDDRTLLLKLPLSVE